MKNYNLELYKSICNEVIDKTISKDDAKNVLIEIIDDYIIQRDERSCERYNLNNNIERFINEKEREGLSKKSIKGYKIQLKIFNEYTDKNVSLITKDDITKFLAYREDNYNISSKGSLQTIRSILKVFFDWMENEKIIYINPMTKVKPFRQPETYVEALSKAEVDKIRNACYSLRAKALIEIFCSTGCTLNEITMLDIESINWDTNEIIINNEIRGNRVVFLFPTSSKVVKDYLDARNDNCPALFVSERKPFKRMGERAIQREIKKILASTNLRKKISPRTFRHTFAKLMLDNGCPMNVLQTLLGNKEYTSTSETYFRVTSNNRKQIYDKYFQI